MKQVKAPIGEYYFLPGCLPSLHLKSRIGEGFYFIGSHEMQMYEVGSTIYD